MVTGILGNQQKNILLTGIPRSGTTLCCRLLNELKNTLALVEPFSVESIRGFDSRESSLGKIIELVGEARQLAEKGFAVCKLSNGKIAENIISEKSHDGALRKPQIQLGEVCLDEALSVSGTLFIKHNAMFTALLNQLKKQFPVYAMVRNPLSVLASWSSVDLPVGQGRVPAGELFCKDLKQRLDKEPTLLARQIAILDWFFQQYKALEASNILRYEALLVSRYEALKPMIHSVELKSSANRGSLENQNSRYDQAQLTFLAEALLKSDGAYWDFYSRADVAELVP